MYHLDPQKSGMVIGALVGGFHFMWAMIIAAGWGQAVIDFIFWMHFLKPVFVIDAFAIDRAVVLILVAAAIGYVIGLSDAVLWNRLHTR